MVPVFIEKRQRRHMGETKGARPFSNPGLLPSRKNYRPFRFDVQAHDPKPLQGRFYAGLRQDLVMEAPAGGTTVFLEQHQERTGVRFATKVYSLCRILGGLR